MPGVSDIYAALASGNHDPNDQPAPFSPQAFVRMIVLDVISDPNFSITKENKKEEYEGIGVSNMFYYADLPRNTIVVKSAKKQGLPMFAFPFFPSHIALPCKVGESVWVFIENDKAFWFCKITESRLADDVNHTHCGNSFEISHDMSTTELIDADKNGTSETGENIWHELRNGYVSVTAGERVTVPETVILTGEAEDVFEKLVTETDASQLTSYESVPRFSKRPGDVALEGTNNTLIVLGSDRKDELKKTSFDGSSGMIDIVAGRGQTKKTYGTAADTTRIVAGKKKGEKIKSELNKSPSVLEADEGNPDFKNDRSRIIVSQRTSVDKNFELESYNNGKFDISDSSDGDAAIVIKTDKIRLIARADVEIIVKGFSQEKSPDGQKRKDEEADVEKWASIVIKANGDIVMKPSKEGYIKLGSEKADLAVLCEKATKLSGVVTCPAGITDTMGGIQGLGGPGQGQFATKVLLF